MRGYRCDIRTELELNESTKVECVVVSSVYINKSETTWLYEYHVSI